MEKIVFFLLFLLPFVVFPLGVSPFETPKVYVVEIGIIILILWYLVKNPVSSILDKRFLPFGLLGVLYGVHLFISPSDTVLFGNSFRMAGVFLLLLLLAFSVVSSSIRISPPSPKIITSLLGAQLISAILIEGNITNRAVGTLGEANSLAAYAVFLLSFLLFPAKSQGDRWDEWVRAAGFIIGVIIIFFSGSRSGVIALGILIVFYLLQRYSQKLAVLLCVGLGILTLALPFFQQGQLFSNRATIWQTGITAGIMKPFAGWGPGNTEKALIPAAVKLENVLRFEYVDHTHNVFIEYWVIGGVLGLGILLYLVVNAFRKFIRTSDNLATAILLGLLIMMLFNPMSIAIMIPFWWVLGRSVSEEKSIRHHREQP